MATTETRSPVAATAALADPGPLGLAGFAATTLVLSLANATVIDKGGVTAAIALAFFYGGLAQILAGLLEYRRGNTFGTTAFTTYGAFWLAFAFYNLFIPLPLHTNEGSGSFLLVFAIVTAYLSIAALRLSGAILAVFVTLTATYVLLAIGAYTANANVDKIGGWVGIVTAVLAFYASAATVVNETWKRAALPLFPFGR